jgi:hypothetical protein
VFGGLARAKGSRGGVGADVEKTPEQVAFVKVDLGIAMRWMVTQEYGVSVMPTFGFLSDEKKVRRLEFTSRLHFFWLC